MSRQGVLLTAALLALTTPAASCGSASGPTSPASTGLRLQGSVNPPASGTVLRIEDGANGGKTTSTDAQGKYVFLGLERGGFSVTASRSGYFSMTKGVTLLADTSLDFELAIVPFATLVPVDSLTIIGVNLDAQQAFGEGLNIGSACAGQIGGALNLRDATTEAVFATRGVSVPSTLVVRPGARFPYSGCCFSRQEVARLGAYYVNFSWTTVPCP